ncbi:MAG: Beta-barrel assembly-enhancing protease [Herbaspirillum frisingense]|uniref:Beta-barrel assembly-enhancing protease n=1 Tax=Herbaspirillum frisingense TaxID=92645 RepID=A0A7V8FT54_9BURK|nr:MAG: Beta-barrel assembly-enhancing protease [Herbaspirillum frisingense]
MAGWRVKLPAMTNHDPATLARLMGLMCEAIALRGAGRHREALAALDQALALDPGFIPIHLQRADLLTETGDHLGAVAACEACLDIAPAFGDARVAHREALVRLVAQCEAQLAEGGAGDPSAMAFTLARALYKLDRPQEALAGMDRAQATGPGSLAMRALRADILLRLNRHEEALDGYTPAGTEDAEQAALHAFNRADIQWRMGRFDAALASFEEALRLHPDFAEARVGRAHLLLMGGKYREGWREHEARFGIDQLARRQFQGDSAPWRSGEDIRGKRVLLWAEQGQGDALQFARYVAPVAALARQVTVCAPPGLLPLLAPAFPAVDFVAGEQDAPPHDCHASLLSLPFLLDLADPLQGPQPPYLHVDPMRVQNWQERLDAAFATAGDAPRRPRIGIAWAGRQYATIHHSRDVPLAELAPMFDLPVDFVSLQAEVPAGDAAAWAALEGRLQVFRFEDWADTAALAQALDLVITVDTAVAHLAGALGLPAFLMLRLEGEWRWGLQPGRTDWYPSLRLFRQQARGQWGGVVEAIAGACRDRFEQAG